MLTGSGRTAVRLTTMRVSLALLLVSSGFSSGVLVITLRVVTFVGLSVELSDGFVVFSVEASLSVFRATRRTTISALRFGEDGSG